MLNIIRKAIAALKRYSEKNKIKAAVQQLPPDYQTEAMERLMQTIDAPRPEKIRIAGEVFGDIQHRISNDMDRRLQVSRRREEFGKVTELINRLPEEFRHGVLDELTDMADLPNAQRRERIGQLFGEIQVTIEQRFERDIASVKAHYADLKQRMQERVLSPESPRVVIAVDYEGLLQKTKATLALAQLQQEYGRLLKPNNILYITAGLGILFSLSGTYFTFNSHLGDWIGGDEKASMAANAFLTLAANVLEATSLFMLLWFLPEKYAHGIARLLGIAGAMLLVASVVLLILMRTDIGSTMVQTTAGNAGRFQ